MTRAEAMRNAAVQIARIRTGLAERDPRASAELAYRPGGPSISQLEQRIHALRAATAA